MPAEPPLPAVTAPGPVEPPLPAVASAAEPGWTEVCGYHDLLPERGACALVGGEQVAVFRTWDGDMHAVSNYDPFGGAFVLSRGIVGTRGGRPVVVSPLLKNAFDLRTGQSLDEESVRLRVYPVRVSRGRVEVGLR